MRTQIWISALAAVLLANCDQGGSLPPAPQLAAGEGFSANIKSLSTSKMVQVCSAVNISSSGGRTREMSDVVIANSTCAIPLFTVELIARHADQGDIDECLAASRVVVREFNRRFPGHDPMDMYGRC